VLVDRLEAARRNTDTDKLFKLGHPNALAMQVWRKNAWDHFRDVPAYAAFFLSQTAPVNSAAARRS
jgi:hypothetical protein